MTTDARSEVRVDAKVTADFGVAKAMDLDVLNTWPHAMALACPLCRHVGPFSRALVRQGKTYVTREYQCPVCLCTIIVTIRV